MRLFFILYTFLLSLFIIGCDKDCPTCPNVNDYYITNVRGDGLTFYAGSSEWIKVLVTDGNGSPIENCRVDWSVQGDATLYEQSTTTWIRYEDPLVNHYGADPGVARVTIMFSNKTGIVKVKATVFANGKSVILTINVK